MPAYNPYANSSSSGDGASTMAGSMVGPGHTFAPPPGGATSTNGGATSTNGGALRVGPGHVFAPPPGGQTSNAGGASTGLPFHDANYARNRGGSGSILWGSPMTSTASKLPDGLATGSPQYPRNQKVGGMNPAWGQMMKAWQGQQAPLPLEAGLQQQGQNMPVANNGVPAYQGGLMPNPNQAGNPYGQSYPGGIMTSGANYGQPPTSTFNSAGGK